MEVGGKKRKDASKIKKKNASVQFNRLVDSAWEGEIGISVNLFAFSYSSLKIISHSGSYMLVSNTGYLYFL